MSYIVKGQRDLSGLEPARSEEAMATALHTHLSSRSEDAEQRAFRRLCTGRASKRAARDRRLSLGI